MLHRIRLAIFKQCHFQYLGCRWSADKISSCMGSKGIAAFRIQRFIYGNRHHGIHWIKEKLQLEKIKIQIYLAGSIAFESRVS